jgi:hypothetical protein
MNGFLRSEETVRPADGYSWTKSSLSHSREEWRAFLGGIRNGEFDSF